MPTMPVTMLLAAITFLSAPVQALEQPDCTRLEQWAAGFASADSITLAPEVKLHAQFADARTVPLFGSPVSEWEARDFSTVRNMLNQCRRPATKRGDKAAADQLYQAMRSVGEALRPMNLVRQFRTRSAQSMDSIVNYHRVPELPEIIALAQQALNGEDVEAELRTTGIGRSFIDHMRALRQARDYLPASEIESMASTLAAAQKTVAAEQTAVNEEFEAAKQQLAAVPMTQAGARELDQLNQLPVLNKVPRDQALAFQTEVAKKRQAISIAVRQQATQQAAAEAAKPIPIASRLDTLFTGDDVEDVSLRGLRPGIAYQEAKQRMSSDWRFATGAGGDLIFKQYYPTNRDLDRYKQQEHRDGGMFEFETMKDRVGKLVYTEHYTGTLEGFAIRKWLSDRFGKPNAEQATPAALTFNWEDGGTHLQVVASNRPLEQMRAMRGFKSAMKIALWSDDYTDFLAAAEERCRKLMNKPQSELSVQDKMDLMQGCK